MAKIRATKNEDIVDIRDVYLSGSFSTVDDDNIYFKQIIQNFSCGDKKAETISQGKIKAAFDFFTGKLKKLLEKNSLEKAEKLQKSLETAKIGIFDNGHIITSMNLQKKKSLLMLYIKELKRRSTAGLKATG